MELSKKIGIVKFLGTNCDRDVWQAVESSGNSPCWIWYKDSFKIKDYAGLILPGGFSYGDYLRSGALAAQSPVMKSVKEAAKEGVPILGICNGFQILCEAGLLPGTLMANKSLRFIDDWVDLKLENPSSYWGDFQTEQKILGDITNSSSNSNSFSNSFSSSSSNSKNCRLHIAHGEGRYFINKNELEFLWKNKQVWWTYKDNPNGSVDNIAGVMNKTKNVAGLMPHPERAVFDWMGSEDGKSFFSSLH